MEYVLQVYLNALSKVECTVRGEVAFRFEVLVVRIS